MPSAFEQPKAPWYVQFPTSFLKRKYGHSRHSQLCPHVLPPDQEGPELEQARVSRLRRYSTASSTRFGPSRNDELLDPMSQREVEESDPPICSRLLRRDQDTIDAKSIDELDHISQVPHRWKNPCVLPFSKQAVPVEEKRLTSFAARGVH
jgi:hypothetical protein